MIDYVGGPCGGISLHIIERVRFLLPFLFHVGWLTLAVALCSIA